MEATTSRLPTVQKRLAEMGVLDVKFFFAPQQDASLEAVKSNAADVLEHYLDGKTKPMPSFNDATAKIK